MRTTAGFFMPTKKTYNKPVLKISEQIELLKSRGLQIPDEQDAADFLKCTRNVLSIKKEELLRTANL